MSQVRVERDGGEQAPPFALKHGVAAHQAGVADGRSRDAAPGVDEEDQHAPAERAPSERGGWESAGWPPEPAPVFALVDFEDGQGVDIQVPRDEQLPAFRSCRGMDSMPWLSRATLQSMA
jgi:hypothetical protein